MKRFILTLVLGVFVGSAQASFIDPNTSLEWLDLNNTNNLSYNDIINGTGNTWLADGWQYASEQNVKTLFFFYMPDLVITSRTSDHYHPGDFYADWQPDINNDAQNLASSLGNLIGPFGFLAIYDRVSVPNSHDMAAILSGDSFPDQTDGYVQAQNSGGAQDDVRQSNLGHLLVRDAVVPIPAAAWLFGSALGLLGWLRRGKQ